MSDAGDDGVLGGYLMPLTAGRLLELCADVPPETPIVLAAAGGGALCALTASRVRVAERERLGRRVFSYQSEGAPDAGDICILVL